MNFFSLFICTYAILNTRMPFLPDKAKKAGKEGSIIGDVDWHYIRKDKYHETGDFI